MKIDYKIHEIKKDIFAVVVPDTYDRCMLFLKAQEFYESPEFKGRIFSIWEFVKWYSKGDSFNYTIDWDGFNVPFKVAKKLINETETAYDVIFCNILNEILLTYKVSDKSYIMGIGTLKGETFEHELCHALYYTNKDYKRDANKLISQIDKKLYRYICSELEMMGYDSKVFKDEVQAYLTVNPNDLFVFPKISNISKSFRKKLSKYF